MMKIMKLADGGDSRHRHLEERHSRNRVDLVGGKCRGGSIHLLAPRPEAVGRVLRTILGASADYALKGVRMRIDQPRQHRASREPRGLGNIFRYFDNLAGAIRDNGQSRSEVSIRVNVIW